ncbi:hypothetical protein TYRP_011671 [Tyrophagus putrescentiae]|nr:hypothetical protein TYRP_011671 [Tyrophagus putrescentiae]
MASPNQRKLTILFVPLDGYGHINACVGIAERLLAHGHRAVFALEQAWKGKASRYEGVEEVLFVDATRDPSFGANDYWVKVFMQEFKKKFPLEPLDALKAANLELEEQFLYTLLNVDAELERVIQSVRPDVIVADTYVSIPAVYKSGIPWVWLTSAAPLVCLPSDDLPPHRSGFALDSDRAAWAEYRALEQERFTPTGEKFIKKLITEFGMPPPPPEGSGVMHPSPYLNVYAYPEELDAAYLAVRPLPPKWARFDHFIRVSEKASEGNFSLPEDGPGKLVYVSMGSMGCADLDLMKRLISIFSKSAHRFIFSLGPMADQLQPLLSGNMWGSSFVPQTAVLPLVNLVISHGGNNTFIETLYFGKPILVTPLFGDQRDNAQRVTEAGYGSRISPYHCTEQELLAKVDQLLGDEAMRERVRALSSRLQASNSTEKAALAVEALAVAKK